jgi:hypothetical protein
MPRRSSSWDALPDEIVAAVCAGLVADADFAAARLACKGWSRSVARRTVKTLAGRGQLPSGYLLRNLPGLESLAWEIGPEDTDRRYDASPLAHLTALKSLSITLEDDVSLAFAFGVPMQEVVAGIETLTSITSLSLRIEYMRILPRGLLQLTQLQSLALPGCTRVSSLRELELLPLLTSLDLSECSADLSTLPSTTRSLRFNNHMDLDGGDIDSDGCVKLHDIVPAVAASLTSLEITGSRVFDNTRAFGDFKTLMTMTSLETLVMRKCRGFGREALSNLAGGLQRLRSLDLSETFWWADGDGGWDDEEADIGSLASLASLTSLKLNRTPIVTFPDDVGVICSLSRLTGLTSLEVIGLCEYDAVTKEEIQAARSAALVALSAALPGLTTLRV